MRVTLVVIAVFGLLGLAACNTAEGFGRDMQSTGKAIEDEAED